MLVAPRFEVMAPACCLGPIDYPKGALEPRTLQGLPGVIRRFAQVDPETGNAGSMKKFFVTAAHPRADLFTPGWGTPIIGGGYGPLISAEAEQERVFPEFLADQLTHV